VTLLPSSIEVSEANSSAKSNGEANQFWQLEQYILIVFDLISTLLFFVCRPKSLTDSTKDRKRA
jgi:hypothetical protein